MILTSIHMLLLGICRLYPLLKSSLGNVEPLLKVRSDDYCKSLRPIALVKWSCWGVFFWLRRSFEHVPKYLLYSVSAFVQTCTRVPNFVQESYVLHTRYVSM